MFKILPLIFISILYLQAQSFKLLPPQNNNVYFGAFPDFGGSEDTITVKRINTFNTLSKKTIAWAYFSQNWFNGIVYPKADIHTITQSGAVPFVRLLPRSDEEQGSKENKFSLQKIIDGIYDVELTQWAKDAKVDNIPLLMDFAVEANGDWFGWSGVFNGGHTTNEYGDSSYPDGPERFRDAYRHIIDIFRDVGVHHVTWFFHFNYTSYPEESWNQPKYYYPGDAYIDWIGFSLYGAQTLDEDWEGLDFSTQLAEYYSGYEAIHSNKPIALLEFGVTDNHKDGTKSIWLEDAFETILSNPYLKFDAIAPWHENWQNEDETYSTLRLDSSTTSLDMFQEKIVNERFISSLNFGWIDNIDEYNFLVAIYGILLN